MSERDSERAEKQKAQPAAEESLFGRVMGGVKSASSAIADGGSKVLHKGKEVYDENAPKVAATIKENAPKVKHAVVEAANSDVGKAVVKAGKEGYQDEKKHVLGVGAAAKRGDVATVAREAIPLAVGPQGYVAERVMDQALKQGVKALPAEHQSTARQAIELKGLATGHLPDAKHVITGAVLDADTRGKAMVMAQDAGHKVMGWFKSDDKQGEQKAEVKKGNAYDDYDLPKKTETKK